MPFDGYGVTRPALEHCETTARNLDDCHKTCTDCSKNDSSHLIAGTTSGVIAVIIFCSLAHCRF